MIIIITNEHISEGVKRKCEHCPGALAIKSCLNAEWEVLVTPIVVYFRNKLDTNKWFTLNTPRDLIKFIERFDAGFRVEEIRFELDIPQQCRLI